MSDPVTVAILVGGRARRLQGQLKPALRVGEQTIIERQLEQIRATGLRDILFVGRWPAARRGEGRHIADVIDGTGPLGGIYSALLVAATPLVLVLAGDLPFVTAELLEHLTRIGTDEDAVVPRTAEGWHPLCAMYRRRVASRLKARLDRGALRVSDALGELRVGELSGEVLDRMDRHGLLLMNVNSPADHLRASGQSAPRS